MAGRIPRVFINDLLARTDIVDLIDARVKLKKQGKNPFILDSKEPTGDLRAFMRGEVRYASLETSFPQQAAELFDKAVADAKERLENYKRLARG